ncbi:MAG: SpoVA/SpoVAEb family sporulation membrane protein, partial [Syntrophomonadaceae bacterium]
QGTLKAVEESGLLGAISGGVEATSAGITAAIIFGYVAAVLFNPKG